MKRVGAFLLFGAALTLVIVAMLRHKAPRDAIRRAASPSELAMATDNSPRPAPAGSIPQSAVAQASQNYTSTNVPSITPASASKAAGKPPSRAEELLPAFTAFSNWAERFLTRSEPVSLSQGEALACKRREEMLALIQTDPQKALGLAAPFEWRSGLPTNITRQFEQRVDGRGALNVLVATDFDQSKARVSRNVEVNGQNYDAFVYGRRVGQVSQTGIPLHGIALAGKLALQAEPIRVIEVAEAESLAKQRGQTVDKVCGVSGKPADSRNQLTAVEVGGEIRYLCGADHARLLN